MTELPDVIPLFPLPNVVFFPHVPLPLHVFEPRYRAMVRDAADGPRLIGMTLLRGDWQPDYYGNPEVFEVGTAGEMVHCEALPDGRYNILLRGLREFSIQGELSGGEYRRGQVRWREPGADGSVPGDLRRDVGRLVAEYIRQRGGDPDQPQVRGEGIDDAAYVNFLAQHLDGEPIEKQALLQAPSLEARAVGLAEMLRFRLEAARGGGSDSGTVH